MGQNTVLSAAEKAKYTAWRGKGGNDSVTAMRHYTQEAERQVRVYGFAPALEQPETTAARASLDNGSSAAPSSHEQQQHQVPQQPPRGLAAIPLLCAAASEQRSAYLRRLQSTPMSSAWWRRQEPLTATPGSIAAFPEHVLLWVAAAIEHVSLAANKNTEHNNNNSNWIGGHLPSAVGAVLQSFLWPLHNALLAVWMGLILIAAIVGAAATLAQTVLLGSRRTGRTLVSTWNDEVVFAANSVHTLTESHQPVAARVVGLLLQPLPMAVQLTRAVGQDQALWMAGLYTTFVVCTAWYWVIVLPWFLTVVMLGTAMLLGNCFGVIELAGQI
jgi:hypothetical protein